MEIRQSRNLDMTIGKPVTMLVRFTIPLLLGNLFQQMYNVVDSIVVGKYIGPEALAAVGTSLPVFNLLISLFMGVGTGASILISQFYGAREFDKMRRTANTTLVLTFFGGIGLMLIGYFSAPALLRFMQVDATFFDMALSYMRILMLGIAVTLFYNIIAGILRGLGDSRSPLIFLIIASILNVILDLLLIAVFQVGVAGIAIATVGAQLVSVVFALFRLGRVNEHLTFSMKDMKLDKTLSFEVVRLGLPSGLQMSVMSVAMLLQQGMINSFGMEITACFNATMRMDMLVMMPMMSMGMAMTTYVGQNYGARNMDRVRAGVRSGLILCGIIGVTLSAFLFICGRPLMSLFTDVEAVLEPGVAMLRFLSFFYPFAGITMVFAGHLRGVGETRQPMYNALIASLIVRLPLGYMLMTVMGSHVGIYTAMGIGWAVGLLHIVLYYKFGKWRVRVEDRLALLNQADAKEALSAGAKELPAVAATE